MRWRNRRWCSCTRDWVRGAVARLSRQDRRPPRGAGAHLLPLRLWSVGRALAKRTPRFMHEEALKVLPVLLDQLGIDNPL